MSLTGAPDFNQNLTGNPTSQTINEGESANRLLMAGGSNSQSGFWLWASGFENGLNEWGLTPAAGTIGLEATRVYQGSYSCRITTAAGAGAESEIHKSIFSPGTSIGLECLISNNFTSGSNREILIGIKGKNQVAGLWGIAWLVLDIDTIGNGNLYYEVNGVRTLLAQVNNYLSNNIEFFHYLKLVYDPYTNIIKRARFNDLFFEIQVPGYASVNTAQHLQFEIKLKTITAAAATIYVENVIMTAGEP